MPTGPLIIKILGGCGLVAAVTVFVAIMSPAKLPSFKDVRNHYQVSDQWILDRYNRPMESIRNSSRNRTLAWTQLGEVSPEFIRLLLHAEDRRFETHHGVDLKSLAAAIWNFGRRGPRRGASTVTMQVVNEVTGKRATTFGQKLGQALAAIRLERSWSKNEILESYLNLTPFRGELVGLRAASLGLFNKGPQALSAQESALLVSLIRSPNDTPEKVASRSCQLMESSVTSADKKNDCAELLTLSKATLGSRYHIARERDRIPVFSSVFLKNTARAPDAPLETTLDLDIQDIALSAAREQLYDLRDRNVNDASIVVLDTHTGEILSYVGNAGLSSTSAGQIDGVQMRRQAGSTLKPFVYGTAFDLRFLEINSLVEDTPEDIAVGEGSLYSPHDYDHEFQGQVSAAEALGSSLNVPAVRTLELVRENRVIERMSDLGFTELKRSEHYGPSLALGTVDISLLQLTEGYRRLSLSANSHVFSDSTKETLFASLSVPEYRRFTFGLENILTLPFPAAVKTGTSKDMRDNWCVGFTSDYTVGVWVGNFNGSSMWNVSGMSGAAPIWRRIMLSIHHAPPKDRSMAYVAPAQAIQKADLKLSQIRYPQPNMMVGLDPDIPAKLQRMPIKISRPQKGQLLFVDGLKLGRAEELQLWPIRRGSHQIELRTAQGSISDQVHFSVR